MEYLIGDRYQLVLYGAEAIFFHPFINLDGKWEMVGTSGRMTSGM
jgi:hypothetical protein